MEEQVHAAWEKLLPPGHPDLLRAKQNLAGTRRQLGDLQGATMLYEQVHEAREKHLPPEHPYLLSAKQGLAITLRQLGDLGGALALEEYVHAAREKALPPEHPDLLSAKLNLAVTRKELGDLQGALELEELVHSTRERFLPPDHPDLLLAKQNLALTRRELGDLQGALELEEHVHARREELLPPDHPHLLYAKGNLALTRKELGDLQGALELEDFVHAAWEKLLPPEHPDLLTAKLNLAGTLRQQGDLYGALKLCELVHALREKLLPPEHPDLLRAKGVLANTLRQLGDLRSALELEEQVHDAREKLLPPEHPHLLLAKGHLAVTRYRLGDLRGALELEEQVHAAWNALLPPEHPDLLTAKQNLASIRYELGDCDGAYELTRSLLASQLARVATLQCESQRVARATALDELRRYSVALFYSEHPGTESVDDLDEPLLEVLESLRLVSTRTAQVAGAIKALPEAEKIWDLLKDARGRLGDRSHAPPTDASALEAWRKELYDLRVEKDALERELRFKLVDGGLSLDLPTTGRIADALGTGSTWISYLRYPRFSDADSPVDSLLAFVVTPDAVVRRIDLGASEELELLATEWRASVGENVGRGEPIGARAGDKREEIIGRTLFDRLLAPCLSMLEKETTKIHVVLDDFLHLVPIEVLTLPGGKRLGDVLQVRMEVNARRITTAQQPAVKSGVLLAIGGVDFGAQEVPDVRPRVVTATPPSGREGEPGKFTPLPETQPEVKSLGEMYERAVKDDPLVLTKAQANKAALHDHAPNARYLHIATHGWFAPETFKSMLDSVGEDTELFDLFTRAERTITEFAPETLCGLALAGANHGKNEHGRVPGILTAEELATLDLSNCELAVLSACETNVGIRRAGQGIQSLQTALHAAGARTAVTSLWKVDDAATRKLMELFYTYLWVEKLPKAEALWKAKCDLRAAGHPVRDWGAWVLSGDPD